MIIIFLQIGNMYIHIHTRIFVQFYTIRKKSFCTNRHHCNFHYKTFTARLCISLPACGHNARYYSKKKSKIGSIIESFNRSERKKEASNARILTNIISRLIFFIFMFYTHTHTHSYMHMQDFLCFPVLE